MNILKCSGLALGCFYLSRLYKVVCAEHPITILQKRTKSLHIFPLLFLLLFTQYFTETAITHNTIKHYVVPLQGMQFSHRV